MCLDKSFEHKEVAFTLYHQKNSENLYYNFRFKGQRFKGTTGSDRFKQAFKIAKERINDVLYEFENRDAVLLFSAISDYLDFKENQVAKKHLQDTEKHLKLFGAFVGNVKINQINKRMSLDFFNEVRKRPARAVRGTVSEATLNRYKASISGFLKYCVDFDILEKSPMKSIKIKRDAEEGRQRLLTLAEMQSLVKAAKEMSMKESHSNYKVFYFVMRVAANTGMRLGEILNMKWENFLDDGFYTIPKSPNTKRKKRNCYYIPFHADLLQELEIEFARCREGFVFPLKRRASDVFTRIFGRCAKSVGIKDVKFHDIRHFFCSNLNTSVKVAMELMGHSSPATTLSVYSHNHREELKNALVDYPRIG